MPRRGPTIACLAAPLGAIVAVVIVAGTDGLPVEVVVESFSRTS